MRPELDIVLEGHSSANPGHEGQNTFIDVLSCGIQGKEPVETGWGASSTCLCCLLPLHYPETTSRADVLLKVLPSTGLGSHFSHTFSWGFFPNASPLKASKRGVERGLKDFPKETEQFLTV